jgi:hypothetical protein
MQEAFYMLRLIFRAGTGPDFFFARSIRANFCETPQ